MAATTLVGKTVYTFDDAARLTRIDHQDDSATTLDDFDYVYDDAGRVTQETSDLGPTRDYEYDDAGQLASDGTDDWTFDKNGNRTMSGFVTDDGNRLVSDGTWNYQYDDEGNVVAKVEGTTGETWVYAYNHLNQLIEAEHQPDEWSSADLRVEYRYDVRGNRIEKSVDDDADGANPAVVTRFAYDPNGNAWADLDDTSAVTTRRLYHDAVDAVFARIDDSGDVAWYWTDRLGSVRDLMDNTSTIQDHIDYGSFGEVTYESAPAFGDRYKWTARELDAETGLQYSRARYYNFDMAGWMSEDPIGFAAGDANLYRYVGNDPVNATDPSGLLTEAMIPAFRQAYHNSINMMVQYGEQHGQTFDDAQIEAMHEAVATMAIAPDNYQPNPLYNDWIARFTNGIGDAFDFARGVVAGLGSGGWAIVSGMLDSVTGAVTGALDILSNPGRLWDMVDGFITDFSNLLDSDLMTLARQHFPVLFELIDGWRTADPYQRGVMTGRALMIHAQDILGAAGGVARLLARLRRPRPSGGPLSPRPDGDGIDRRPRPCSPRPRNSFVEGTLVLMADGTTKPIEDIKVGDWVWSEDPETGVRGGRPVIDLIFGQGEKELIDIEIDGDTITATAGHPIWLDCCSKWVDAQDLQAGEQVLTAAGYTLTIDSVQGYTVPEQSVYNLTVSGLHTYFVMAGEEAVLVHNTNDRFGDPCDINAGNLRPINPANHGIDAEALKAEFAFGQAGQFNLAVDNATGQIVLVPFPVHEFRAAVTPNAVFLPF